MRALAWLLSLAPIAGFTPMALAEPIIFYSKSFPESLPPYVEITLDQSGEAVYKEDPNDEYPLTFRLSGEDTAAIFALAGKLNHFQSAMESGKPIANLGRKTLRWKNGSETNEQEFNYSENPDVQAIQDWFQKMAETEAHLIVVERAVRFDKLGVNQALLNLQAALERNRLVATGQFLPFLERVVKNESFLNMARQRAAAIADAIQARPENKE
jgi:hypothetical protein